MMLGDKFTKHLINLPSSHVCKFASFAAQNAKCLVSIVHVPNILDHYALV